ncbi:MAG: M20 family metallopeptidase [Chloroflexota bacterium]
MVTLDPVVELTRDLVRFDTTNPPGNEEPAIRHLGAYLQAAGVKVEYQQLETNRLNLIARLRGRQDRGHLVLSGHMDVVPAGDGWHSDPFGSSVIDGRIVGRGTADMKGGVAAMATALAGLARGGFHPSADLILAVSSGEEAGGMQGARLMASTAILGGSSMLVIGEPTDLEICPAQKGVHRWYITAHGTPCHGSTPHLGVSAISYMAHVIPMLEANPFPYADHPLLGAPTVNVMTITGGSTLNIIPDRCTLGVIMRTVPGQDLGRNTAIIEAILARVAADYGLPVRTEVDGAELVAVETPVDHPFLVTVRDAIRTILGREPRLLPFTGATEATVLAPAYDMRSIIFGPGSLAQAHEPNEYVEIAELETAARVYALIARKVLGEAGA